MYRSALIFLAATTILHGQSATFQWIQQIGGSQGQAIAGVGADSQGNVYVAGSTSSADFPVKSAWQPHRGGSAVLRIDGPGGQWQNLYSFGLNSVTALSADPRNPNTVYAAAADGLLHSTDAGATWTALGHPDGTLYGLAIDPSASNVLYAATIGNGVHKSIDGGASWTAINNGIVPYSDGKLYAYNVWVDPHQPNVIFAATSAGLARSSDSGGSWQTNGQFQLARTSGMAFDANTPGLVYAGGFKGLQRSTDDGATWTPLPIPNNIDIVSSSGYFEVDSIVIDPKNPAILYVANAYGGLFKSLDSGNTWALKQLGGGVGYLTADPATGALYASVGSAQILTSLDGFNTSAQVGPTVSYLTSLLLAGQHLFLGSQANSDVFVAKFDPQGNPIYATYFGGAANDQANGMVVDAGGSVYVTGSTGSSDFPVSQGAYAKSGGNFVFKLNPDGSMGYSTYFATPSTTPYAIAVDADGHALITGITHDGLPVTAGAYQTKFAGVYPPCCSIGLGPPPPSNAFLTKFDTAGASLVFSTYVGNQQDVAFALALGPDGSAVLAGSNALYRLNSDGSALLANTTLPASIWAVTEDGAGNIYAGGTTSSSSSQRFPLTSGAFQTFPFPFVQLP